MKCFAFNPRPALRAVPANGDQNAGAGTDVLTQMTSDTITACVSVDNPSADGWIYLWQGLRRESAGTTFLYDGRSRFYSTVLGRWIRPDVGYLDGTNLYQAFGSNPINRLDPFGNIEFAGGGGFDAGAWGSGRITPFRHGIQPPVVLRLARPLEQTFRTIVAAVIIIRCLQSQFQRCSTRSLNISAILQYLDSRHEFAASAVRAYNIQ